MEAIQQDIQSIFQLQRYILILKYKTKYKKKNINVIEFSTDKTSDFDIPFNINY